MAAVMRPAHALAGRGHGMHHPIARQATGVQGLAGTATATGIATASAIATSLAGAVSVTTAVPAVSGNAGDPSAAIATLLSAYMAANPELYQSNSAAIASISEYLAQGGYAAAAAQVSAPSGAATSLAGSVTAVESGLPSGTNSVAKPKGTDTASDVDDDISMSGSGSMDAPLPTSETKMGTNGAGKGTHVNTKMAWGVTLLMGLGLFAMA